MPAFPNRYDPSRRRRRRDAASHHRAPLTQFATAAAVAYAVYQLGSWAWNAYLGDDDKDDNEEGNTNNNDILYEWSGDVRTVERDIRKEEGFDSEEERCCSAEADEEEDGDDGTDDNASSVNGRSRRSRRSRVDWGDGHNKPRSHRPSPPKGYHHHGAIEEETIKGSGDGQCDGVVERYTKGAAAGASAGIGIGSVVSAGISAGIRAYNQNIQAGDSDGSPGDNQQERRLRMGRCRLETSRAMMDFLPTLRKAIARETDVAAETEELKRLRTQKKKMLEKRRNAVDYRGDNNDTDQIIISDEANDEEEELREEERRLWNDVKNKSVTRLFATVYAHTIVFLVLTVQVNLLGGRLLRDERREEKESMMLGERQPSTTKTTSGAAAAATDRYRASHQAVLAKTYHYLFSRGIPSLVESAGEEVESILRRWDVASGDEISLRDVSAWMDCFRGEMEHRRLQQREDDTMSPLAKFIIPPEGDAETDATADATTTNDDELAKFILDETYDLLESPAYANAERACLDATFDHLRTKVFGKLFLTEEEEHMLLANVVTHFRKTAVSTFHKPPSHGEEMKSWGGVLGMMEEPLPSMVPNDYVSKLERLDAVRELSDVCF